MYSLKATGVNEGTSVSLGVLDVPTYGSEDEQISWKSNDEDDDDEVSMCKDDDDNADNEDDDDQDDDNEQIESDNDGDDFVHPKFSTYDEEERQDEEDKEEECSDLRIHTPSHYDSTDDEVYDEVTQGGNVEDEKLDEEKSNEEEEVNEMYRDVNVNLERRDTKMTDAPQTNVQATQVIEDTHVIITAVNPEVQQQSSSVSSSFISKMLNPNPDTGIDFILNLNIESTSLVDVPVTTNAEIPPSSFEDRVKYLEDDFSEFKQTNLFAEAVSSIPGIIDKYLANQMNEAVKAVKIIKQQVKVQVKEHVSKILPRIEKSVNEQLKADVLIRSSNEAKTSHAVAANLSELELNKILIDKIENNKSIDRSVQQKTLYKALVEVYETDKDILATYGDNVTFKRRRGDEDKDEEPSAGSNQRSKRRRAGKEPESSSAPKKKTSKSTGKSKEGSKSYQKSTGKSTQAEEPTHTIEYLEEPAHQEFNTGFTEDQPIDETTQLPDCRTYATSVTKTKAADYGHIKWIEDLVPNTMWNVYSKRRIIAVTKLQIVEWHNYKHLDWITVRRDDDKLYTFKEGDFNRLHIQDIEDMLFLLTTLDDRLKGIQMKYLPQTIWRQSDRDKAGAMIQEINKQLKTRRIMRSLEKFVEHQSDTKVFTMTMEILLEPTSNKLMVDPHGFEGYLKMKVKERISKSKRAKTSKNQQEMKRQVQERDMRKDIKAGSARQQEKKVNEDPIEVKGSIMTSFQKFKGSFGCFESPRTKDVKVRKLVY
ncbi:hypothetical protein Tco_0006490 [Tanacetum coccineum]